METFSALLALCTGNSLVTGDFPSQRPATRSFDVFCDLRLNKRLSKRPCNGCHKSSLTWAIRYCDVMVTDCSRVVSKDAFMITTTLLTRTAWHGRSSSLVFITVTSWWARWRLKSPASLLFAQLLVQAQIKENIKAPHHWPLWREFTGDRWTEKN